jgi:AcrR family transcriptional regulator
VDPAHSLVRPPRQRRSAETLERIVRAAEELLVEREWDSATVDDIVRRAKSSKGSFYSRFPDKGALLEYLTIRTLAGASDLWRDRLDPARWRGVPVTALIDHFIDVSIHDYRRAPAPLRALFIHSLEHPNDSEFDALTAELNATIRDQLSTLLRERADEFSHPRPATAARVVFLMVDVLVRELVFFEEPRQGPLRLSDRALRTELRRSLRAYLGVNRAGSPAATA